MSKKIVTMAGEFRELAELKDYCNQQYTTLTKTLEENQQLKEEINHLKSLLSGAVPVMQSNVEQVIIQDEEMICMMQIQRLRDLAQKRELTLDEVKKLDLLHKNLKLSRGENTVVVGKNKKDLNQYSEAQLVQIAAAKETNE